MPGRAVRTPSPILQAQDKIITRADPEPALLVAQQAVGILEQFVHRCVPQRRKSAVLEKENPRLGRAQPHNSLNNAAMRLPLNPSAAASGAKRPFSHTTTPASVPTQIRPLLSSARAVIESAGRPSRSVKVVNRPSCKRVSPPPSPPIQRSPRVSPKSVRTGPLCRPSRRPNDTKRRPSKRATPSLLPTHRQPSQVWPRART